MYGCRGSVRGRNECGYRVFRPGNSRHLLSGQLLCERYLGVFGFDRYLFPEGLFVLSLA